MGANAVAGVETWELPMCNHHIHRHIHSCLRAYAAVYTTQSRSDLDLPCRAWPQAAAWGRAGTCVHDTWIGGGGGGGGGLVCSRSPSGNLWVAHTCVAVLLVPIGLH